MSDDKFINQLKQIKEKINQTKEQNKKAVEKLKNTNVIERRRVITAIVNLELIEKMYKDGIIFDPRDPHSELCFYINEERLAIPDVLNLLRSRLESLR